MNARTYEDLKKELSARGFTAEGASPNDTMVLGDMFMREMAIGDLLDMMVTRREKILRAFAVVGPEETKKSYDDVVLIIDAIKGVLGSLDS